MAIWLLRSGDDHGVERAPVGGDERAVQDEVGKSLLYGPFQGLAQRRRLRGEDFDASSLYRYTVAWEIPKPWPSRRMSGQSRNYARVNTACFQQVRARVPSRMPISRR
jgi:hypothetical protein